MPRARQTPPDPVEKLIQQVNKTSGGRVLLQRGRDFRNTFLKRRPTGSFGLDVALNGGWGAGTIAQIYGTESAGKNDILYRSFAENQRIWGSASNLCLVAIEFQMDKSQARHVGVRVALSPYELAVMAKSLGRELTPEEEAELTSEVGVVTQLVAVDTESALEGALNVLRSNLFQYVAVDSIGGMTTRAALDEEVGGKQGRAAGRDRAALLADFCAKCVNLFNRGVDTTVVVLNQVREDLAALPGGRFHGPQTRVSGGRALKHAKCADVEISRYKWRLEEGSAFDSTTKEPSAGYLHYGTGVQWYLAKAKAGAHEGPRGRYIRYVADHGPWRAWEINECAEIRVQATRLGLIRLHKNRLCIPLLDGSGKYRAVESRSAIAERLETDRPYREALAGAVIEEVLRQSGHVIAAPEIRG